MAFAKYSEDKVEAIDDTPEHKVHLGGARRYSGIDTATGPVLSALSDDAMGDWSWKPLRDKALGENMVTFRGVPPSPAEMSHR